MKENGLLHRLFGLPFSIIKRKEYKYFVVIYLVNVISSISEVGGIGMIYVFFSVLLDLENLGGFTILSEIYHWANIQDKRLFISYLAGVLLVIFVARNLFLMLGTFVALHFRRKLELRIVRDVYRACLNASYSDVVKIPSNRIVTDITSNIGIAVLHCAMGIVEILSSITLLLLFLLVLAFEKPHETMLVVPFLFFGGLLYWRVVRSRLAAWGQANVVAVRRILKWVSDSLNGIKSVKTYHLETYFENQALQNIEKLMGILVRNGIIKIFPNIVLELIIISIVMTSIIVAINLNYTIESIVGTIVLFGGISIRVTPALSKVIAAVQQFKISTPSLESVIQTLKDIKGIGSDEVQFFPVRSTNNAVELENVDFAFQSDRPVLSCVNISISRNSFVGFVGSSGSGKTTTADLILGLLKPEKGILRVNEEIAQNEALLFGYVPQEPFVIDGTLAENIAIGVAEEDRDDTQLAYAIKGAALSGLLAKLSHGLDSPLGEKGGNLSGGERQRLGIARALYFNAPILVLDEPTSALDVETEFEVTEVIHRLSADKTIIVIAHRLSTLKECDKLYFFNQGKIVESDSFTNLARDSAEFKSMLGYYQQQLVKDESEI